MAQISVGSIYTDGFDVYLSGLDSDKKNGYQFDDRTVEWCIGSKRYGWGDPLPAYAEEGGYFTFSGLKSGTTYTVKAVVHFTEHTSYGTKSFTAKVTTDKEEVYVEKWNWNQSNGEATKS